MTETFPRSRNGWTDSGKQIASTIGQKCPNCGSSKYRQTLSTEECTNCGLKVDYWGGGANTVCKNMMERQHRDEEDERRQKSDEWARNHCGDQYDGL
jgi:hypothetical protein